MHNTADAARILDIFQKHGHNEVDTARIYGAGSSEEMLADVDWQARGLVMDTKLYPNLGTTLQSADSYSHRPEDIRRV